MSELKPCPFCGGAAEMEHSYHEDNNRYPRDFWHVKVSCSQCYMASTGWNSYGNQEQKVANFHIKQQAEQEAAAEWNRRPTLTPAADVEIENAGMISSIREFGAQGDWIAVRINDDGWDVLTAEASRTVLRPTPATDDRANIIATADRLARRMGGEFVLNDDVETRARELLAATVTPAFPGKAEWLIAGNNDLIWDTRDALAAISAALRTADAPSDEGREAMTAVEAFDMGYAWQQMLRGQTLEDSRAVGRTLYCDLFEPIAPAIHREVEAQGFNSFQDSDLGICAAKAIIKAAIRNPEAMGGTVVDDAQGGVDREAIIRECAEAVETVRNRWFCSGPDCSEYDHGRDEGVQLSQDAILALLAGGSER